MSRFDGWNTSARHIAMAVCAAAMIALAGCGGDDSAGETPLPESSPATGAGGNSPDVAPAPGASGGLHGKITFNGPKPERDVLDVEGDAKCAIMHEDDPLYSDREVVNDAGEVAYTFVYLKNPPEGDFRPSERKVLDQVGCRYTPHVMGVMAGEEFIVRNSDDTVHNIRSFPERRREDRNKAFNITTMPDNERDRVFEFAENAIRFKCDIHPWMEAFVFAMSHPFFDTSRENGQFSIPGLPAGDYTVVAWHETYGEKEATVTVDENGEGEVNFEYVPVD